jgi:hypothetical protein
MKSEQVATYCSMFSATSQRAARGETFNVPEKNPVTLVAASVSDGERISSSAAPAVTAVRPTAGPSSLDILPAPQSAHRVCR